MKTITLLILLLSITTFSTKKENIVSSKYSCVVNTHDNGRCTGSAYCRACKNCSRCAYCSNGGSCGVCSSGETYKKEKKTFYESEKKNNTNTKKEKNKEIIVGQTIYVNTQTLNLRSGAGKSFEIIKTLKRNDKLIYITNKGEWINVKVELSKNIGWVNINYIK